MSNNDPDDRRLAEIEERLRRAREKRDEVRQIEAPNSKLGIAFRLVTELMAALIVGGAIGWGLDRILGTGPFLFIVMFMVGVAAGMFNVVREAQKMNRDQASKDAENSKRNEGLVAASPMEQFEVVPIVPIELGGYDISFTNASLWMCIVAAVAALFLTMGASSRKLVPTRMQSLAEMSYTFVADMIRSAAGTEGLQFFPFVFTLFMFVLFANLVGLCRHRVHPSRSRATSSSPSRSRCSSF
jgi:F0F1-type ATP synthase assembly protein I